MSGLNCAVDGIHFFCACKKSRSQLLSCGKIECDDIDSLYLMSIPKSEEKCVQVVTDFVLRE